MHKLLVLLAAICVATLFLTGCSAEKTQPGTQQAGSPQPPTEQKGAQAPGDPALAAKESQKPSPGTRQPAGQKPAAETPAPEQNYSMNVGGVFPPFTLQDLDGMHHDSKDIISSNKVTVINFWGTFCGPCIKEMPDLEALRQKYDGKGLGVIGVVIDSRNKEEAARLAAQTGTGYPHLLDNGRFGELIFAVPHTVIVDSKGKVLSAVTGTRTVSQFSAMVDIHLE